MGRADSRPISRHEREVVRVDRRWLLAWIASFAMSLGLLVGAYAIYKATGPHPQIRAFIRQLKHEARWLIPGLKKKPNAKDQGVGRDPDRRYAGVDRARAQGRRRHGRIGHTAQRASTSPGRRGAVQPASRSSR